MSGLALGTVGALVVASALIRHRGSRSQAAELGCPQHLGPLRRETDIVTERFRGWLKDIPYAGEDGFELLDHEVALRRSFGRHLLGFGYRRVVLSTSDPTVVLKLATRPSDNLDEAAFWRDAGPKTRAILVPVLDVDPAGRWLLMERVTPYPWENGDIEEDVPGFTALQVRAKAIGLLDIHLANVSTDLRILDYAEPVTSRGSPARRLAR